jgi:hypothetical protein
MTSGGSTYSKMKSFLASVKINANEARLLVDRLSKERASILADGLGLTAAALSKKIEVALKVDPLKPGETILNDRTSIEGIVLEMEDEFVVVAAKNGASMTGYSIERWFVDVVLR